MTHFPDIHTRAQRIMRESRGRFNLKEAYQELSRRGHAAKVEKRAAHLPPSFQKPVTFAWQQRADLA